MAWSILSREWHCVYLGSWGGEESSSKNELEALSCSFCPKCQVLNTHEVKNMPLLVQNEERMCKMCSDPSVYLGGHWRHSRDQMDQAFPLHFAYCKKSKTGWWEGLETKATFYFVPNKHWISFVPRLLVSGKKKGLGVYCLCITIIHCWTVV